MPLTLYGLKNCDTCKKALKALGDQDVHFVDIRAEADLEKKVPAWLKAAGAEALVNKRSTTWRQLSDAEKAAGESGDAADLLIAHPTLIKRPVIEEDKAVHVGWTPAISKALLGE